MEGGPAGCPQVFVVDRQAPVTLRPSVVKRDFSKKKEYLLYLLVGLALLGVVIEAGFIYHLYKPSTAVQIPSPEKIIGYKESGAESNKIHPVQDKKPDYNKPAAFLQGKAVRVDGVMQWQTEGLGSFLSKVGYEDDRLLIQTEGYYYIHSKVYFSDTCSLFRHQVLWKTSRYREDPKLMQALRYSCMEGETSEESSHNVGNSFLGGVFRLYKNDSVYVQVNNRSLVRTGVQDNFFGIFMI